MKDYTIAELREFTKEGATIRLTKGFVKNMITKDNDGCRATNDLAWLWDCTMENGNSEAFVYTHKDANDPNKTVFEFEFSQVGSCSVGIVFNVRFACLEDEIPMEFYNKMGGKEYVVEGMCGVFGEDIWDELGGFLSLDAIKYAEISYDPFEDEEDEEEEGFDFGEE